MPLIPDYMPPRMEKGPPIRMAVASLCCGILSVLLIWAALIGLVLAILAVIFGNIASEDIHNGIAGGLRMARAGKVCGQTVLVIYGLVLTAAIVFYLVETLMPSSHL